MSLQLNCKSLLERDESSYEKNLEYNKTLKKSVSTFHLLKNKGGTMSKKYDRAELLLKSMGVCLFFILLILVGFIFYL